jgi:hypothetical protein
MEKAHHHQHSAYITSNNAQIETLTSDFAAKISWTTIKASLPSVDSVFNRT